MEENRNCKYCNKDMKKVAVGMDSDWGVEYLLVCLNDECGYYIRGWDWMRAKFNQNCSYRHKYDPFNEIEGPIPVFKPDDYKNLVIE